MPSGVHSPLNNETFFKICDEIATSDQSAVKICRKFGIIHNKFWNALNTVGEDGVEGRAARCKKYAQARRDQVESLLDAINDLHDEVEQKVLTIDDSKRANALVQAYRLKIDDYKWRASKLLPKMYGDTQYIEISEITSQIVDAMIAVIRKHVPPDSVDQAISELQSVVGRSI